MSKTNDVIIQLEEIINQLKNQEQENFVLKLSTAGAIEELMNNTKESCIFKWVNPTGIYMVNNQFRTLTENTYYAVCKAGEDVPANLQSIYLSDTNNNLTIYTSIEQAQLALVELPIDGTIAIYIGNDNEETGTYTETFVSYDGYDVECTVCAWYNTILISSHEDTVDEYGNLLRKYKWNALAHLPVGSGVGTLDIGVCAGGGAMEFDVKDFSKVRITAINGFEYNCVDTLPTPGAGYENKIYEFDNKYYMVGAVKLGDNYNYCWVECEVNSDAYGGSAVLPIVTDGGRKAEGTREEYFAGTCTFDVANVDTFVGHAPEIMYVDIDEASNMTVTDHNTLYTDRNGDTWMLAKGQYDNYTYVRCSIECDINGWDALIPIIDEEEN